MGALHKLYQQLSAPAASRKSLERCLLMELCYTSLLSSQNASSSPTLCSGWYFNSLLTVRKKLRSLRDFIFLTGVCDKGDTTKPPARDVTELRTCCRQRDAQNYGWRLLWKAEGLQPQQRPGSQSHQLINDCLSPSQGAIKHRRTYQRKILYGTRQERRRRGRGEEEERKRRGRGGVETCIPIM